MELLGEVWRRALLAQEPPSAGMVALTAAAALGLVWWRATWRITRLLVTITHEGAHALVAVATGRRLRGIRLHTDTSGLTLSSGRRGGPGMVATLAAGYLGPAGVGLAAVGLLSTGHALGLLWLWSLPLAGMLLQIRNAYGLLVLAIAIGSLVTGSWLLPARALSTAAYLLTWVLLLAAPRPVWELFLARRGGRGSTSDADQLSQLTPVPAIGWIGLFGLANLAGLGLAVVWLLPDVVGLARAVGEALARG